MDALIRRRMMMMESGGTPPTPPPTPTPTEGAYIRNTSLGAYIDTGITPDDSTKIIVWARNFNPAADNYTWLCGSRVAYKDSMFDIVLGNNERNGRITYTFGNQALTWINGWDYISNYHKYELSSNGFYIDDSLVASVTSSSFSSNLNIYLFGHNSAGTFEGNVLPTDICAAQIYKSGVLVRDMFAVNSPSVGMFDSVTNSLFTNAGSGSFTYGVFNKNAYIPLDYILCNGTQYFDSGVKGSFADGVVCRFMPTATSAHLYDILGVVDETNGSLRFTIGSTSSLNSRMYFNMGNTTLTISLYNSESPRLTNLDLVVVKNYSDKIAYLYRNFAQIGTTATASGSSGFETGGTMIVGGAKNYNLTTRAFIGRLNYISFASQRNYVPAKVNNVAGLYDTYNDVFYPSTSGTDFIAGNELQTI